MAIAELTGQRCTAGTAGATTITLTYPGTPTEGNLLVAAISWRINATISAVPSGWSLATNGGNGSGLDSAIYYKLAGASEPTAHQWTLSASAKAAAVGGEWSGIASASPLDKAVVGGTNSTVTVNAGNTGTLSQADELIVCLYSAVNIEAWTALSDSQTQIGNVSSTGGSTGSRNTTRMAANIVSATTAANFTSTLEFSQLNSGAVATFKAGGAATHAATGALPGLSASITGSSQHRAKHATSGVLAGQGASVSGASTRYRQHATSGDLPGLSASLAGSSQHKGKHTTTGVLPGLSASIAGSSARFLAHPTAGVLTGQGAQVSGASARYTLHSAIGVLPGQGASVSGSSQHRALHTGLGALAGQSASIAGSSVRYRQHATDGVLPGQTASISGEAATPGALTHESSGVLNGQGSSVAGSSVHVATYPVRYIRDYLNGSSGNAASYWVEIQAFDGAGANIASGATVTANFTPSEGALTQITNADTNTNNYVSSANANSRVTVDLGSTYNIASVTRFHYNGDNRTFFGTKTETSVDGITWTVIFSSAVSGTYAEQTGGKNDVTIAPPAVNEQQLGSIIPSYTLDAEDWTDYTRTASIPGSYAIINPSSGPGTVTDSTIAEYVTRYHAAGGKILGYISSSYAGTVNTARTVAAVKADVDTYISLYSIDGFFIDEMTATDSGGNIAYYDEVYDYIKLQGSYQVVGNAGAALVEIYASTPVADTFVIFEGTAASIANFAMPVWTDNYAPTKFAWMAHTTSTIGAATDIIVRARNENTYYVFVTDDILANPYDTAPSYWSAFAADLAVTSGYLVGQGSVIAGEATHSSGPVTHATSGALPGLTAVIAGSSAHIALHVTSGTLPGQVSTIAGSSTRFRQYSTSGVLTGQSATITGVAERFTGVVTHATSGVLAGPGSTIAGSSGRYRQLSASGVLAGQGASVSGSSAHITLHATSGVLSGESTNLSGSATRYRQHTGDGVLPGQTAAISGDSSRFSGAVSHGTSGALTGQGSAASGSSSRYRQLSTSGALTGSGVVISGSSAHIARHATNGALTGQGAAVNGNSARFRTYSTSGALPGQAAVITGSATLILPAIRGVTRDSTGAALGSCVVHLFETSNDILNTYTTSDASGNYVLYPTAGGPFYIVAYKTGSPDVAGTTVNTLMPT